MAESKDEKRAGATSTPAAEDFFLVTFDSPSAPQDPKSFSLFLKYTLTTLLSLCTFTRILLSTILAPALPLLTEQFDLSPSEAPLSLSIFLLATAFGPLLLGPLSEVYGRTLVLHGTNVWFLAWNICCGFSNTKEVLLVGRFMCGFGASAVYALGGGIVGDIWRREERGRGLAAYTLVPLIASAIGPLIGGYVATSIGWRWIFHSTSIFQAVLIGLCLIFFRETHAPTILRRHAAKLRKETGDARYQTVGEREITPQTLRRPTDASQQPQLGADPTEGGKSPQVIQQSAITQERPILENHLLTALRRPLNFLITHHPIQLAAIISAFEYGLLYILISTYSEMYTSQYSISIESSGLHYLALALGELIASQASGPLMDWWYRREQGKLVRLGGEEAINDTTAQENIENEVRGPRPEARLPIIWPFGALYPAMLLLMGWAASSSLPWPVVDLAALLCAGGGQIAGMSRTAYLVDAYPTHTSSVLAALQLGNSLSAFGFPLFAPALYSGLGYGWGNTLLAGVALIIGGGLPVVLWKFGEGWRVKKSMR